MDSNQLYQSHQGFWKTLSALLVRAERDIRQLSPQEIEQMGQLYRVATSDLALAQRDFPRHSVTKYLNQLVAHGHSVIYRSEPFAGSRLRRFVTQDFPRVYREMLPYTLAATLMFWLPAVLAFFVVLVQPDTSRWLLPEQAQELRATIEEGKLWTDIPLAERPYTSTFIMRNNIQVAFLAFGGGLLAGLYTSWIMIFNGLMLGGMLGLTGHYGLGFDLATFVIGHGVIELSVIIMAGGAGLMIGWAIIHPGLLRRADAIKVAANRSILIVIGCVPLLIIAGTIEGFISPAENLPWMMKWAVGLVSGILLYAYLFLAARPPRLKRYAIPMPVKAGSALSAPGSD